MKDLRDKLIQEIRDFNKRMDWDQFHSPENLAKSISIEAGELLECFQWNSNYNKEELCEEMADVYSYLLMLSDAIGVDLDKIGLAKLQKTQAKYPVDKFKGISTKYNKLGE